MTRADLAAHDRTCNWVFGTSLVLLVAGTFYCASMTVLLLWPMVHP